MYANRDSPLSAGAQNSIQYSNFLDVANSVTIAMRTLSLLL